MLMIARYTAPVALMPPPCWRRQCHNVSTASPAGCSLIAFSLTLVRRRWCGARPLASCHNFQAVCCVSVVHLLLPSVPFETSLSSSTTISERPPTFGEPCHAASLHSASFVTFVVMSLMTVFVHRLCRLYTLGSTRAILSWSGFRLIYSGNSSPFSTL